MSNVAKLGTGRTIVFAFGNFGWSLGTFGIANLLTYFYVPNVVDGQSMFPAFIGKNAIFFGLTILGMIIGSGRLFDAVTDPLIAGLSDRSRSKFGKRRLYMLLGGLPLALFSFLIFIPPVNGISWLNALWVAVSLFLFYLAFTMYAVPYNALVSEYGHNPKERLDISTIISLAWAMGFAIGNSSYILQGVFENKGFSSVESFQLTMVIFGVLTLITLYLPVIFINESKYAMTTVSNEGSFSAMLSSLKNKNFRSFLLSELSYWFALTFIQMGISYYIVTLLKLEKEFSSVVMYILFGCSFLFYIPINIFAKKYGKRITEIIGFTVFGLVYVMVTLMGNMPVPGVVQGIIVGVMASLPMAIFGIIPVALIADVAEADGITTGNYKTGIFYAMRGLFMKFGSSFAGLLFPTIIQIGGTDVNPFGVRLTGFVALAFCGLGAVILYFGYNEKEVLNILKSKN